MPENMFSLHWNHNLRNLPFMSIIRCSVCIYLQQAAILLCVFTYIFGNKNNVFDLLSLVWSSMFFTFVNAISSHIERSLRMLSYWLLFQCFSIKTKKYWVKNIHKNPKASHQQIKKNSKISNRRHFYVKLLVILAFSYNNSIIYLHKNLNIKYLTIQSTFILHFI